MHVDTAKCYSALGQLFFAAGDYLQAVAYQQQALIVNERLRGPDHTEVIAGYSQIAYSYHAAGNRELACKQMFRAIYLAEIVWGRYHPQTINIIMSTARLYQETEQFASGQAILKDGLQRAQTSLGDHPLTSQFHYAIALGYKIFEDYRSAAKHTNAHYRILESIYGADHATTKHAKELVNAYTAKAVENAKQNKGKTRGVASVEDKDAAVLACKGNLSIDALMEFIDGPQAMHKKGAEKKHTSQQHLKLQAPASPTTNAKKSPKPSVKAGHQAQQHISSFNKLTVRSDLVDSSEPVTPLHAVATEQELQTFVTVERKKKKANGKPDSPVGHNGDAPTAGKGKNKNKNKKSKSAKAQ
eukprot:GFYU01010455.1.p1 GENE.GFYU01010455.1~~GFYU01010455.1.p1  ORF type:complete len:357 (+),score=118.11 GFYU01010455.1:2-1072(+)